MLSWVYRKRGLMASYYKISPVEIIEDIKKTTQINNVSVLGCELKVFPGVYPPERFRTTNFLIQSLKPLFYGRSVCDMGCGTGVLGIHAILEGAKHVVFADINATAIKNTEANLRINQLINKNTNFYVSDCFDSIPKQQFDLIVFNIPFHNDDLIIEHPLEYAFYDPNFISVKNFLTQAKSYCSEHSQIVIAFSNKGDVYGLEDQFAECGYEYYLWQIANQSDAHDNRLYILRSR